MNSSTPFTTEDSGDHGGGVGNVMILVLTFMATHSASMAICAVWSLCTTDAKGAVRSRSRVAMGSAHRFNVDNGDGWDVEGWDIVPRRQGSHGSKGNAGSTKRGRQDNDVQCRCARLNALHGADDVRHDNKRFNVCWRCCAPSRQDTGEHKEETQDERKCESHCEGCYQTDGCHPYKELM